MIIFLSNKYEDRSYANGMDGLLNNPNNEYRHVTEREKEDLRSKGEKAWKNYLKEIIKNCDVLTCLIGKDTHNAQGVIYELEVATSLGIKIIPVRIPNTTSPSPQIIRNKNIIPWNAKEINNAISLD